jgi:dolichyl-phosphate-mannose--protein O-mannosyl transferase
LGAYFVWIIAWLVEPKAKKDEQPLSVLANLRQINLWQFLVNFAVVPVITYSLLWIPHLIMNPEPNFLKAQWEILSFHERIGSSADVHPYCSTWYSWLVMWRPVAYFYDTAKSFADPVPQTPPLAPGEGGILYAVHAMGNPFLWWLSTAVILLLVIYFLKLIWQKLNGSGKSWSGGEWLAVYLVANWAANLLPWVRVNRCIFLYHYMGASVFASLGLAWLVDRWLVSRSINQKVAGIVILLLVVGAFIFWMPVYLGLPLSVAGYQARMWFSNWI